MAKSVLVVGDIHGDWAVFASLLAVCKPDICLVTGDFGWWPKFPPQIWEIIPENLLARTEIRFCDGNHEDHHYLLELAPRGTYQAVELYQNIWYQPRGSTFALPDGRLVLFVGGADSIDKPYRTKNKNWFAEELLEFSDLPEILPKADIVISHTIPQAFGLQVGDEWVEWKFKDPSCKVLDKVLEIVQPRWWFAGHWHLSNSGLYNNTEWHILDKTDGMYFSTHKSCLYWLVGNQEFAEGILLPNGDLFKPNNGLFLTKNLPQEYRELLASSQLEAKQMQRIAHDWWDSHWQDLKNAKTNS